MSIDARIVGSRKLDGEDEVKLTLEDRPGGGPAGQGTLRIVNIDTSEPSWLSVLESLIDNDVWGNSSEIMLGDQKLAERIGLNRIKLLDGWADIIKSETS